MATTLSNLVNPQVMADMISATLPQAIKFSPIAAIDTTLVGRPGNTITVPKYAYIGDAEDVAEGVQMGTTVLTASTTTATVKKAGKAVELTDEAVLSGYGDPVGETAKQLTMAIAAKIDNDCAECFEDASLIKATAVALTYDNIVDAVGLFEDESDPNTEKILYIAPVQADEIRKDDDFIDKNKYGGDVMATGEIGMIAGARIVKSKKVKLVKYEADDSGAITIVDDDTDEDDTSLHLDTVMANAIDHDLEVGDKVSAIASPYWANPIVVVDVEDPNKDPDADGYSTTQPAITIYMKRDVMVESDRDILAKTTVISADEHFVAVLSNDSKVVLAKFLKA